jgi:excisionase family DNA binding protein
MERTHITPKEVAQRLGVSVERVLAFIADGALRAANVGRGRRPRWLVALDDLDAWLRSRSTRAELPVVDPVAMGAVRRARRRRAANSVTADGAEEGRREWV